jgi:hypothetical protein
MLTAALMGLLQEAFKRKAYSASGWTRLPENEITFNSIFLSGKKNCQFGCVIGWQMLVNAGI